MIIAACACGTTARSVDGFWLLPYILKFVFVADACLNSWRGHTALFYKYMHIAPRGRQGYVYYRYWAALVAHSAQLRTTTSGLINVCNTSVMLLC